jgi:hypothetical protein
MADESHVTLRTVNWREALPFTQIFRAFRVAIHPSKLMLALAALLCLYLGGRVLDALWPVQSRAIPRVDRGSEVEYFEKYRSETGAEREAVGFADQRKVGRKHLEDQYAGALVQRGIVADPNLAAEAARKADRLSDLRDKIIKERDTRVENAKKQYDTAKAEADKEKDAKKKDEMRDAAERDYKLAVAKAYEDATKEYERYSAIKGQGIFIQFFDYEVDQVHGVVHSVLANDWLGGFLGNPPKPGRTQSGVFAHITNFLVTGPWWMISQHTFYFILFAIIFSVVWALFGGAISRIAAVHVARDEKISMTGALRFATGKFLSFIFAPVIPLAIVLFVGAIVALAAVINNIPWIGPILVGLLFFLALIAGFVMALVLLGTVGGFNLMYPTIAVEGSDSFDAISRSFSYVYARPWRMLFYTVIAVLYGALCYFFVKFFIFLMLTLTHHFVDVGTWKDIDSSVPVEMWPQVWPAPSFEKLSYEPNWMALHADQKAGAFLIAFWNYLAIGLLGAFAISFYFSANTIIYYLMRREVDATELDDVYLEQGDEEFGGEPAPGAGAPGAPGTTPTGVVTTTETVTVVTGTTPTSSAAPPAEPPPGGTTPPPSSNPDQSTPPPAGG